MKKHLILIISFCFLICTRSFAQVDSAKISQTEQQIGKDRKKADKLQRRADKKEKKMKRQERKMQRKEKKRDRKIKKAQQGERKLEQMKKDSTSTRFLLGFPPLAALDQRKDLLRAS